MLNIHKQADAHRDTVFLNSPFSFSATEGHLLNARILYIQP